MQIKLAIWLKAAMNLRMLLWLLQATAKTSFDQMSFFSGFQMPALYLNRVRQNKSKMQFFFVEKIKIIFYHEINCNCLKLYKLLINQI